MRDIPNIRKISKLIFDYFILPLFIFFYLYEPNFLHGYIFSFDEGQHLAWISGILRGKIPYRDLYMIYGPLLEYIPSLLMKIFGYSFQVLRSFYHFGTIASFILVYFLCRVLLKTRLFVFIATWLCINLGVFPKWSSRWGGIRLGSGIMALLFLIVYFNKRRKLLLYVSGITAGLSFLISQEIGICVIIATFLSLVGVNYYWKEGFKGAVKKIVIYILGIITALLPIIVYFLFTGAFLHYLRIMFFDVPFKFPLIYKDDYPFLALPRSFSGQLWLNYLTTRTFYFYGAIAVYCSSFVYLLKRFLQKRVSLDVLYMLMLSGFGLPLFKTATRMLGGPQLNIALPPVIILACLFIEKVFIITKDCLGVIKTKLSYVRKSAGGRNDFCFCGSGKKYKNCCLGRRVFTLQDIAKISFLTLIILIFLMQVVISTNPTVNIASMFNKFKAARQERQWLAPLELKYAKGVYVPEAQAKILSSVVEYLQDKLSQEEEIFVLPHEGHYHFLLNKPSASRFDSALFAEVDPNYEKEVVEAIEKAKVRYIIYDRASYLVTDHNPVPNEKRIPEIVDYVLKNYTIIHQVEGTLVLERKGVS